MHWKHTGEPHKEVIFGTRVVRETLVFSASSRLPVAIKRPILQLSSLFAHSSVVDTAKPFAWNELPLGLSAHSAYHNYRFCQAAVAVVLQVRAPARVATPPLSAHTAAEREIRACCRLFAVRLFGNGPFLRAPRQLNNDRIGRTVYRLRDPRRIGRRIHLGSVPTTCRAVQLVNRNHGNAMRTESAAVAGLKSRQ